MVQKTLIDPELRQSLIPMAQVPLCPGICIWHGDLNSSGREEDVPRADEM